ncbi:hypothetical protein, partial [Desulfovibrio sp. JC022]|uniref:hypothetical protein n=1 Tax=Desulfovibrio sp. JC022 TaxID=2593642 RepID=UPI0013D388A9
SDPRIYGTTLAAAALPGVIAGGILAGGELATVGAATARRAAPHVSRGLEKLGKAAKRTRDLVRDTGRKADINIKNNSAKATKGKYEVDSNDVVEGATTFIDGLPPSNGKLSGPIGALYGLNDAGKNGREVVQEVKNKSGNKKNK